MTQANDANLFGKVAVLYGGESTEREISLMTGKAVLQALLEKGVDAAGVDTRDMELTSLAAAGFDRVWIALHGRGYEDGAVQGVFDMTGLPYTGSGVLGSALAMDKRRSKLLFEAAGLATPAWVLARSKDDLGQVLDQIGLPCVVKPATEGSSVGVSLVHQADELAAAWRSAANDDNEVIVERLIDGPEYTAGVLNDEVLPLIHIETPRTFYDYKAKYTSDRTRYHCPSGLTADRERELAGLSKTAFDIVAASGWGRVDFMLDSEGTAHFLEVNTVPGMTSHSLVPMAAAQAGLDFSTLVWRILETSLARGELS